MNEILPFQGRGAAHCYLRRLFKAAGNLQLFSFNSLTEVENDFLNRLHLRLNELVDLLHCFIESNGFL